MSAKRLEKIEIQLESLSGEVRGLQDSILFLKSSLDPVIQTEKEKSFVAQFKLHSGRQMSKFLDRRTNNCELWDWCSRRVERATSLILQAFIEEGPASAIQEADFHIQSVISMKKDDLQCLDAQECNEDCCNNIVSTFESLKELLEAYLDRPIERSAAKEISKKDLSHLSSEQMTNLLKPLSNRVRLEILKELGKGGKHYTTIERKLGIKGGHLQYHLDSLLDAGYISKDRSFGNYHLTRQGLRILHTIFQLQEAI
ncbi:MAG: winged helix-turn-helix domain-containing protein [Candidatus Thorarchaeota archaeon]